MSTIYHIFTDGKNEYIEHLATAQRIFNQWKRNGATRIRIYKLTDAEKEKTEKEEYIQGFGDFPW